MSFTPSRLALCAISLGLAACSTPQDDNLRYQSTNKAKASSLATPPDVMQLMSTQGGIASPRVASASDYHAAGPQTIAPSNAPDAIGDVRMESEGRHRWLVVGRTPEQLWEPMRKFWQDNGFVLEIDQPERRIMETDWAESHAKVSTGLVRDAVASLASTPELSQGTAEMDRFRTRLEQIPGGGTEIYVSHRGLREVADTSRDAHTAWLAQPADAELEAEWLRRMMARLGEVPGAATTTAAQAPVAPKRGPQIVDPKGQPTLQLAENFDLAWRHVGLALDRTGFTVEDRNRSEGTYFVRYVPPNLNGKEPGAFAKLVDFVHPGPVAAPLKLGIQVRSDNETSTVTVVGRADATVAPADALRIVQVIAADLQ